MSQRSQGTDLLRFLEHCENSRGNVKGDGKLLQVFEHRSNWIKFTFKISEEVNDDGVLITPDMLFTEHVLCAKHITCIISFNLSNSCMIAVAVAILIVQMRQSLHG